MLVAPVDRVLRRTTPLVDLYVIAPEPISWVDEWVGIGDRSDAQCHRAPILERIRPPTAYALARLE
ncbi:MAG: hypothetical protein ACRDYX_17160 [Egibacteraceae bacterium]